VRFLLPKDGRRKGRSELYCGKIRWKRNLDPQKKESDQDEKEIDQSKRTRHRSGESMDQVAYKARKGKQRNKEILVGRGRSRPS
jgi:hypothetical protein